MSSLASVLEHVVSTVSALGGYQFEQSIRPEVVERLDAAANAKEGAAVACRRELQGRATAFLKDQNPIAFSELFETYQEGLFWLLARERGVVLDRLGGKGPDYVLSACNEAYEVKTINFATGADRYPAIAQEGRQRENEARDEVRQQDRRVSRRRLSGGLRMGAGASYVDPHAEKLIDAVRMTMKSIANNVNARQFQQHPTVLVVSLARTNLHSGEEELVALREDPDYGLMSGQLWTLAAHQLGDLFYTPEVRDDRGAVVGQVLDRAGVLRDFAFIRAIVFIHDCGDSAARDHILSRYRLHGVWNSAFSPSEDAPATTGFFKLCGATARHGFVDIESEDQ